jgi:hypothetical protein
MKGKVSVVAQSFNRRTLKPTSEPLTEVIDLDNNTLFAKVCVPLDIKKAFEAFWNDLNPKSTDVVFVQRVAL